jgi:SAM-dependent methyltransferase
VSKEHFNKEYFVNRQGKDLKRQASFAQEISFVKARVSSGNILDVGCSTGEFIKALEWDGDCYGMEISDYASREAKKNGVKFDKDLFSAESFFDAIVFRGTIQLVDTPFLYIKKALKALKPGGYLFFLATPNTNSPYFRIFGEHPVLRPKINYYVPSDVSLTHACQNYGFSFVEKHFPYWRSPYRSFVRDHVFFLLKLIGFPIKKGFPFWGNMMDLAFRKRS